MCLNKLRSALTYVKTKYYKSGNPWVVFFKIMLTTTCILLKCALTKGKFVSEVGGYSFILYL